METNNRPVPTSTYRLQLSAEFTFADATQQLDYLAELVNNHHSAANIAAYAGIIKERAG